MLAIGIAPRMQDLHGDQPAGVMHPVCNTTMIGNIRGGKQPCRPRKHPALPVRRHAARHHQRDTTLRPLGVKGGDPVPVAGLLQPGMHRPHQHPVGQGDMAQIERG